MIAVSCSPCGMKLRLKKECSGHTYRCPICNQPMTGNLEHDTRPRLKLFPGPSATPTQIGARYLIEGEIARGGMGTVLRALDRDLRREVALKCLLHPADSEKKMRFLVEAQITGQLEHPNIVPVHELSVDQERPFFTMKMVKGRSLAQVLKDLREDPGPAEKDWTLGRLLNIFVSACNALTYAHARGVIHRDLKSANIMIGDFGEVYVMDWGVAKVLQGQPWAEAPAWAEAALATPTMEPFPVAAPPAVPPGPTDSAPRPGQVVTSREPGIELTQDGDVLGTPFYMPPEQAAGKAADQRSDVYSLGAILYEMLSLQPPVEKEGGYLNVIMRVLDGEIIPPEIRDPQRARAGKVPRELSAIALKALAKDPWDRYPSVLALRRDVERFQEGRSVSAKEDSCWETAWKLVKRNQGASMAAIIGVLALAVVVGLSFVAVNNARLRAERANANYLTEREAKQTLALNSVPAYLRAAHLAVTEQEFTAALVYVETALEHQPDHEEAHLLKGQLLIVQRQFTAAAEELANYVKRRPDKQGAARLLAICQAARRDDQATQLAFAAAFTEQNAFQLADGMLKQLGANAVSVRKQLLELYQKRIDAAWPGLGNRLSIDASGTVALNLNNCPQVTDLGPLKGMPLGRLYLQQCPVRDLTPLHDMPLAILFLGECQEVRDLTPLKGMRLSCLNLYRCSQIADLKPLEDMPLTVLDLSGCPVRDLTPLRGMPLTWLNLGGCGQVADLTPLQKMPLTRLFVLNCGQVRDLTPLRGMRLTEVSLTPKNITRGLHVLRDMKSLKTVTTSWAGDSFTAENFWKRYEAGEFNR